MQDPNDHDGRAGLPGTLARLLVVVAAACSSPSATPERPTEAPATVPATAEPAAAWYTVESSERVAVRVEPRLYQRAGSELFLVRIRVANRGDHELGVDLRDYWAVTYPNQWGALAEPRRAVIDETRAYPSILDAARCADLRRGFHARELTRIPPGGAIDYYREFNGSGRADVDRQATEKYLFVSLAGQTLVTDGERCENLPAGSPGDSDLVIAAPIPWATVPVSAIVVDPGRRHQVLRSAAGEAMIALAQKSAGLAPGDDSTCASDPTHPHFWSYQPTTSVPEVVRELQSMCVAIGPHLAMNTAQWCCLPALPER